MELTGLSRARLKRWKTANQTSIVSSSLARALGERGPQRHMMRSLGLANFSAKTAKNLLSEAPPSLSH